MRHGIAVQPVITLSALPLGLLITARLAEYVFNPMMDYNGTWAGTVGRVIGLMFIIAGVFNVLALVAGALYPRIWHVEDELPNAAIVR